MNSLPGHIRPHPMGAPASPSFYGSRLVHLLSGFTPAGADGSGYRFVDRFGQLVGLQDSISLSRVHAELPAMVFKPDGLATADTAKAVRETFLSTRKSLVTTIAMSFVPHSGHIKEKLPTPDGLHAHFLFTGVYAARRSGSAQTHASAFEPYRKFYVTRQIEMETRIQQLRSLVGTRISFLSPELARLEKLDSCLAKVLSGSVRDLFAVIPKQLERRFASGFDTHRRDLPKEPTASDLAEWILPGGWIWTFCGEMRELLLAELDVRLQPVLGMIDSLPPETTAADSSWDEEKKGPES
ncbi:MAG: DUF3348 family protein [Pseudomonadota bacterium]